MIEKVTIKSEKIKPSKQQGDFTRLYSHPSPFQLGYFNDDTLIFKQILILYNLFLKNFSLEEKK